MQLGLIAGIIFAIVAAMFAMQNITPVTVTLGIWSFEGSLALVLLTTLGIGALIAGLVTSPAMIRRQWAVASLGHRVADLEHKLASETRRNEELRAELARLGTNADSLPQQSTEEKPYVGLRALIAGSDTEGKPAP